MEAEIKQPGNGSGSRMWMKRTQHGLCQILLNETSAEAKEAGSEGGRSRGTTESVEVSGGR